MTMTNKLASAALAGLLSAGVLVAQPVMAGDHEKGACKGKSGCKGAAQAEKSECKSHSDKAGCEGKEKEATGAEKTGDKAACKGASGCASKDKEEKKQ